MSSVTLTNVTPVPLSCQVKPDNTLDAMYKHTSILDGELLIQLDRMTEATIVVADFVQDGVHYRVSAHTIENDGTLTPWPRIEGGVHLPNLRPLSDGDLLLDAQITAVGYDDTNIASARVSSALLRRMSQCRVQTRVGNSGSLPY